MRDRRCPTGGPILVINQKWAGKPGITLHPNGAFQRLTVRPVTHLIYRAGDVDPYEAEVRPGEVTRLGPICLELIGEVEADPFAAVPLVARSALPRGTLILGVSGGKIFGDLETGVGRFNLAGWTGEITSVYAITDRLQWPILPALSYQLGDAGGVEWIPWAGMYNWGFAFGDRDAKIADGFYLPDLWLSAFIGFGLDVRVWLTQTISLNLATSSTSAARISPSEEGRLVPDTWRQNLILGYSHTLPAPLDMVTVNFSVGGHGNWLSEGVPPRVISTQSQRFDFAVSFGSIYWRSIRRLPLLQFYLTDYLYFDIYALWLYDFPANAWQETFLLGIGTVLE